MDSPEDWKVRSKERETREERNDEIHMSFILHSWNILWTRSAKERSRVRSPQGQRKVQVIYP